jgi:predicted nucleic acid-binding protein
MNLRVCIDANIIVWSLLSFPLSDSAEALLRDYRERDAILIAPTLLAYEVSATLRRLVYLKQITPAEGEDAYARFQRIDIHLMSRADIFLLAWELAKELNRPRTYDTAYLATAKLNGCDLWTADEKLFNAVKAKLSWVKWLGNF